MHGAEESAVTDFLQILEDHRKNCEQQAKYVEADIAKNRLEELKTHDDNRRKEVMRTRHIAERLGVEEAHMLESQQHNITWDKKVEDNTNHAEGLIAAMKERHIAELGEFQKKLLAKQKRPMFSTELLNYRKIQERLAKARDYKEAHKVKIKADRLETFETKMWLEKSQQGREQHEKKFKLSKQQELTALRKRIQTGREGQKKQRRIDLERLLQRYQNMKNELDVQHNLERMRAEKQLQK